VYHLSLQPLARARKRRRWLPSAKPKPGTSKNNVALKLNDKLRLPNEQPKKPAVPKNNGV
jgi:hypothetical protein